MPDTNSLIAIFITVTAIAVAVVMLMTGKGPQTLNEKINSECIRSYGSQSEEVLANCRNAMMDRYLNDEERERANRTYSRIR